MASAHPARVGHRDLRPFRAVPVQDLVAPAIPGGGRVRANGPAVGRRRAEDPVEHAGVPWLRHLPATPRQRSRADAGVPQAGAAGPQAVPPGRRPMPWRRICASAAALGPGSRTARPAATAGPPPATAAAMTSDMPASIVTARIGIRMTFTMCPLPPAAPTRGPQPPAGVPRFPQIVPVHRPERNGVVQEACLSPARRPASSPVTGRRDDQRGSC